MPHTQFYYIILICPANAILQVLILTVLLFNENVDAPQNKIGIHAKAILYE